jgi:hypothetical protein
MDAHKNLQPCTEEERWTRPTTYAVKVKGINKAKRVLSSHDEACAWLDNSNLKGAYIEKEKEKTQSVLDTVIMLNIVNIIGIINEMFIMR